MSTLKVNTIQSNTTVTLDVNSPVPSLDVTGSVSVGENINASGIITASSFSGNVNATGISTFTTLSATSIVGVSTLGVTTAYVNTLSGISTINASSDIFINRSLKFASGYGIDFSAASNAAGMTGELLNDYEEGTFTPTLTGASVAGTTTYTRQDGIYTKIGRQVTVSVFMQISNATGSGTIRLGGLPFTIGSYYSQGSVMVGGYNWSGGTYLNLVAPPTSNYFDVYYSGDDIGWAIQSVVNESQDWLYTVTYNV
jgi:hypothetical protein